MKVFALLIAVLPIVWRAECAPKIPKASAASVAATIAPEWYCATICAGGCGGRPHYDTLKQVCRCTINEHIDDGDMELIKKTANIIEMKIKFYKVTKVKRALEDSHEENASEQDDKDEEPKPKETTTKPKKFTPFGPFKQPLFGIGDLKSRLQKPKEEASPPVVHTVPEDAILGQVDPSLYDTEAHHNIYPASAAGKLFGGPILGQMNPSIREIEPHHNINAGFPYPSLPAVPSFAAPGYPQHLTPALTRSLLFNVRDKLDNLLLRTQQYPYQPAITAHETESMRNTLKQITQVNVNVRPAATTFGYFFNNLVNQLAPILRAEAPDATHADGSHNGELSVPSSSTVPVSKEIKGPKHHKSGKVPVELGKKTSTKVPGTLKLPLEVATTSIPTSTLTPVEVLEVETITVTPDQEHVPVSQTLIPIEQIFTIPTEHTTEVTTAKFLPVEDGDELVGESAEYLYEEDD